MFDEAALESMRRDFEMYDRLRREVRRFPERFYPTCPGCGKLMTEGTAYKWDNGTYCPRCHLDNLDALSEEMRIDVKAEYSPF